MRRAGCALSVVLVIGAGLGACGSSKSAAPSKASSSGDVKLLGTPHPATGAPLTIGYESVGVTQTVDESAELDTARATVKYINEYLGGVAGRPLALMSCLDQGTPAGTTSCANQFIAAKVPIVLAGEPVAPSSDLALLTPAKIPYMIDTTGDSTALFSPDADIISNPLIILSAPAALAKAAHETHIGMITVNVPAAQSLPGLAAPIAAKAGLKLTATAVPLGSADVTPQIQSLLSAGSNYFLVIGDQSLCISSLNALKTLGYKGQVTSEDNCLTGASTNPVSGGFEGLNVPATYEDNGTTAESKLLAAIAAKYAPGTAVGNQTNSGYVGYVVVSDFQRAMTGVTPAEFTSAGISAALANMKPQPTALLPGGTFQCNHKASTLLTAVCSNAGIVQNISPTGKITSFTPFSS